MVKPAWGYAHTEFSDQVEFPVGWEQGERRYQLLHRRAFFEITLHDWVVKHDLEGDGGIIKTLIKKGIGMDRPSKFDELKLDLKMH
jgi:hypothetical protein